MTGKLEPDRRSVSRDFEIGVDVSLRIDPRPNVERQKRVEPWYGRSPEEIVFG